MFVTVHVNQARQRLDKVLAKLLPFYSRSQIKRWILDKKVIVNNQISVLPKKKMIGGELIEIRNLNQYNNIYQNNVIVPENINLDIVYEDHDILVINKPSNMVVHPGCGNYNNTVLNALLYKYPSNFDISNRAGIVHRLDKDTTGLMIIAKTFIAYDNLRLLFKRRQVIKKYDAIVFGKFSHFNGTINQPIRRHVIRRTCMMVHATGKPAITHYSVTETFNMYSRLSISTETGRTHQIRVHMAYINHPLVGDRKYGKFLFSKPKISNKSLCDHLIYFNRPALHAYKLQLMHPITQIMMTWVAPLPYDIVNLINALRCKIN